MSSRKTITVTCLVCAAFACLGAAQSASAATASTCQHRTGSIGAYKDADCTETGPPLTSEYNAVRLTPGVSTEVEWHSWEPQPIVIWTSVGGAEVQISCGGFTGTGSLVDEEVGGEGVSSGSGIAWKVSECTVNKPTGQGCKVKAGGFSFASAKSVSFEIGEEVRVKVSPTSGTVLAETTLEGCKTAELNATYKITGSIILIPEGARQKSTPQSSEEGKLRIASQPAFVELTWTFQMAPVGGVAQNPILYTSGL
jgi:hypothetical protein